MLFIWESMCFDPESQETGFRCVCVWEVSLRHLTLALDDWTTRTPQLSELYTLRVYESSLTHTTALCVHLPHLEYTSQVSLTPLLSVYTFHT